MKRTMKRLCVAATCIAIFAAVGGASASSSSRPSVGAIGARATAKVTLKPLADAYVDRARPRKNYGRAKKLRVAVAPAKRAYLRFRIRRMSAPVSRAILQIYTLNRSRAGYAVSGVARNRWSERRIRYTRAPKMARRKSASSGAFKARVWTGVDVTRLVRGNATVSFGLTSTSRRVVALASRESGRTAPKLIVETGGPPPPGTGPGPGPGPGPVQPPGRPVQPPPGQPATLIAAGSIASCRSKGDEATAFLVGRIAGTVATLGDNVYPNGTPQDFAACYNPSWGRFKARTLPSAGNREYNTPGAAGYFGYFGPAAGDPTKGYYSYELGTWHVVVLNSNCRAVGGCQAGSPQEQFLRADLAANRKACTLAYWHHPRFSSTVPGGETEAYRPFWQALYDAGAEIVLTAHGRNYERFAPQTPAGSVDAQRGIRQFIVGSGGVGHSRAGLPVANSEVRNDDTFGVLRLTLDRSGYDWQFVPEQGKTFSDSGSGNCH